MQGDRGRALDREDFDVDPPSDLLQQLQTEASGDEAACVGRAKLLWRPQLGLGQARDGDLRVGPGPDPALEVLWGLLGFEEEGQVGVSVEQLGEGLEPERLEVLAGLVLEGRDGDRGQDRLEGREETLGN